MEELTKAQEDTMLEAGRERDYSEKEKDHSIVKAMKECFIGQKVRLLTKEGNIFTFKRTL